MSWNILYRGKFVNQETDSTNANVQQTATVDIYDTESGTAISPTGIVSLEMADDPCITEVVNNEEDKLQVIRSKQLDIAIHTSSSIGLETFCEGGDQRWYVEMYTGVEMLFKGWLSISDLKEQFQPDPNVMLLTATDGLGFLEAEDLTDLDGNIPENERTFIELLTWALAKTGLSLPIMVCLNIREKLAIALNDDTTGEGHFLVYNSIDCKTFEGDSPGTLHDCLQAINKILGELCFVEQKNGLWWIQLVDEMRIGTARYFTRFDETGAFVLNTTIAIESFIGAASPMQWMNDDAEASTERPVKKVTLDYKYELFAELVCNINFDRGAVISPPDLAAPTSTGTYELDCWTLRRQFDQPVTSTKRIERKFEFGYEKERYAVVTPCTGGTATPWDFIESSPIEVQAKDRLSISVDFRFPSDFGLGEGAVTYYPMRIYLFGEDGNWYYWWNPDTSTDASTFFWTNAGTSEEERLIPVGFILDTTDESQWQTISTTLHDMPVNGKLYIGLNQLHQGADSGDDQEAWFSNLQITYSPFINGQYTKFTGQQQIVTQPANPQKYKAIRQQQVYISDSPKKLFKGAILKRGDDFLIFTGTVGFSGVGQDFDLSGDHRSTFKPGMLIIISGTASNNITARITSVNYAIFTDLTQVFLDKVTVAEVGVTATIKLAQYVLANQFYDAAAYPAGDFPDDAIHPFGQLQVFGVWYQYNRVMRKFEGTIDKLQSATRHPDLIDMFYLSDPNPNTNNKIFMLLHCVINHHLCSWEGFFHELADSTISRSYTGNSFKYTQ